MREPNSHECSYFGRKLGNTRCAIEVSLGYVVIGSENDDSIYFGECLEKGEEMLKERVTITAMFEPESFDDGPMEDGHCFDIDLEDVLRFAAKYCNGIYKRVLQESEEK